MHNSIKHYFGDLRDRVRISREPPYSGRLFRRARLSIPYSKSASLCSQLSPLEPRWQDGKTPPCRPVAFLRPARAFAEWTNAGFEHFWANVRGVGRAGFAHIHE